MPLDVLRLRDSDLMALATGDEFKAAVSLWCVAWHQVPAGSLPDDDRLLARFSGAGPAWRKLREGALRGFVKCSDGRLYHSTIAEKAREAWASKQAQRARTAAATAAREQRRRELEAQRLGQRDVVRDVQRDEPRNDQRDVARDVHQGTGTGTGTGTVKGQGDPVVDAAASPTPAAGAAATRGTRLPSDWQLPKAWGDWVLSEMPGWTPETVRLEAAKFGDFWHAKTGKDATKADWLATWRNWCRNARHATGGSASSHRPTATERRAAIVEAFTGQKASHDRPDHPIVVDIAARVVE